MLLGIGSEATDVSFIREKDLTETTKTYLDILHNGSCEDSPAYAWAFGDEDTEPEENKWFGQCELPHCALVIPPGCAVVRAVTYFHEY